MACSDRPAPNREQLSRAVQWSRAARDQSGFTLVELLVVMAIVAMLATLVGPRVLGYLGKAKSETAQVQIRNLQSALELYYLDVGEYPTAEQGLGALVTVPAGVAGWNGPYMRNQESTTDPWNRPYLYQIPGEHGPFDLVSLGRDGRDGGDGEDRDLTGW